MSDSITGGGASASAGPSSAPASAAPSQSAGTTSAPQGTQQTADTSSTPTAPAATPGQGPQTPSEPPRERWDSILANARQKARAEAEAEFRARYAKYDAFEQDEFGAVQNWIQRASQHSLYGPQVQQWLQQQVQPQRQRIEAPPKPNVPIVDAQGRITGYTYDADGLEAVRQYDRQQLQAEYDRRLTPLEQFQQQQYQQQQHLMMQQQAHQQAQQTLAQLREQPYFKDNEAKIYQALLEHEEWGSNVHQAYAHVMATEILPNLATAEQQRVVDTINQKAGSSTVSPRGTAAGTPQFKSFGAAARYFAEHPDEAADWANRR